MGQKIGFDYSGFDKVREELNRYKSALRMIASLYPKDAKVRSAAEWEILCDKMASITQVALDKRRL